MSVLTLRDIGRFKARATRLATKNGHPRLSASGAGTDYQTWKNLPDADGKWQGECAAYCVKCNAEVLIIPSEDPAIGGMGINFTCAEYSARK